MGPEAYDLRTWRLEQTNKLRSADVWIRWRRSFDHLLAQVFVLFYSARNCARTEELVVSANRSGMPHPHGNDAKPSTGCSTSGESRHPLMYGLIETVKPAGCISADLVCYQIASRGDHAVCVCSG